MIASDTLKQYFLEELGSLRADAGEFARDYPVVAGHLKLGAAPSQDPHVELLLQSFAYLTGQLRYSMDCQDAELPGQLMQALNPALACPTPCMAVVQLQVDGGAANFAKLNTLLKGEELSGQGSWAGKAERCRFTTLDDAELWPLEVTDVAPVSLNALPSASVPAGAQAALRITVKCRGAGLFEMPLRKLRIFLGGPNQYQLYDLLSRGVVGVGVCPGEGKPLRGLPGDSLNCSLRGSPVVWDAETVGHPGLALLREYFACPQRFLFFTIQGINTTGYVDELQLLIFLAEPCPKITKADFLLNCVPVANLYRQRAEPIALRAGCVQYPLEGDRLRRATCEVHSVVALTLTGADGQQRDLAPLYTDNADAELFWTLTREVSQSPAAPGTQTHVAFINRDFVPEMPAGAVVGGSLRCTDRRLAESLSVGDKLAVGRASCAQKGVLVTAPSAHQIPPLDGEGAQRLCAQLSQYCLPLCGGEASLAQLKAVLLQHCERNNALALQQIDGLRSIAHERVAERVGREAWHGLVTGIELTLTVEHAKYAESSALLFGEVLSECFAGFAPLNSFVRLQMADVGGKVLKRWALRTRTEWS